MTDKNLPMVVTSVPLTVSQEMPDFLKNMEKNVTGMEGMVKSDFKLPELKLLQGQSPETDAYPGLAKKNEFWHTGLSKSLGVRVRSVIAIAKKRTILWRPKNDNGGGILAVSDDGINWRMGGNKQFSVMLKGAKSPVLWNTRNNVIDSGLTEFGTQNPADENSPPAATVYYEYLLYLPEFEDASPVLLRLKSTALDNGRALNSYFILRAKAIFAHVIDWTVEFRSGNGNDWTVPKHIPSGWVDQNTYKIVEEMNTNYASKMDDLVVEQEDDASVKDANQPAY